MTNNNEKQRSSEPNSLKSDDQTSPPLSVTFQLFFIIFNNAANTVRGGLGRTDLFFIVSVETFLVILPLSAVRITRKKHIR